MKETPEKLQFQARYGSPEYVDTAIRMAEDEPQIRCAMKNPAFDREHHELMMKHAVPWVRNLAPLSPHVTADDLTHMIGHDLSRYGTKHSDALGRIMSHPLARTEDIMKVAMSPQVHHLVKRTAVQYLHTRRALTPNNLRDIENAANPPSIPMHIWNSVLPKDHEPLTQTDIHNHMVKHSGGTLK